MSDWTVPDLVKEYQEGGISRRQFVRTLLAAGITMPMIASVLAACGGGKKETGEAGRVVTTTPQAASTFVPTRRGGGGTLKLLWWQAPVLLNAHLATGTKDFDASTIFTEPLAQYDPEGNLFPVLAAEVPSLDNGGVARDGKSVTWKLKRDVGWHDGRPFTAEDVVFTYEYVIDKDTAATSYGNYSNIDRVEKIDDYTVRVLFKEPVPAWYIPFVGGGGHIFPKHILQPFKGKAAREAPFNLKPIGTGPYKFVDFKPGDILIAEINDKYHVPNRPFFDRVEMKGGGDAASAARAVLQTGEIDHAWNIQVEYDVLERLERESADGRLVVYAGTSTEHIQFNFTDPNVEVDGERSSIKTKHPFFSDLKVRQAFSLAFNRKAVVDALYGKTGAVGRFMLFNPPKYVPPNTPPGEFNLQKANQLLDEAGWRRGADGVRTKDGKRMRVVYQTSENSVRQKTQAIIKKDLESIGVEVELKAINADVYFGGDPGNPDSLRRFSTDLQMYTTGPGSPDPQSFMERFVSKGGERVAQKANNWQGVNIERYQNPEYDKLWDAARVELDPIKRTELFRQMNKLTMLDDIVTVPLVERGAVAVAKKNLAGQDFSSWTSSLYKLAFWHRTTTR
jgi:peptide/nickel transport system substrate-binding protein